MNKLHLNFKVKNMQNDYKVKSMQEITNLFFHISYHCPYWYNKIFVFFAKVYANIKYGKFVCPLFANMKPCIETV